MSIINGNYVVKNEETEEEHCYDDIAEARHKLVNLTDAGITATFKKSHDCGAHAIIRFKGRT